MKKFLICVGILYGMYWYASRRWDFADTLVYAHANQGKSWAPAVDYWVGMVYYQRAEYGKAQEAFTQLTVDHSTSSYMASGLLRLSEVAEENRDWPVARQSLERYIAEFPNDKKIRVAEQRYEMIKFK